MKNTYHKECDYCSNHFLSSNYRKKYCCATCKTYASHERNGKLNEAQVFIKNQTEDKFFEKLQHYFAPSFDEKIYKGNYKFIDRLCNIHSVKKIKGNTYKVTSTNIKIIRALKSKYEGERIVQTIAIANLMHKEVTSAKYYKCFSVVIYEPL